MKEITKEQLKGMVEKRSVPVVDVRSEEWFEGTRIPGAHWVPLPEVESKFPRMFNPEDEVVLYCGSYQCPQSAQAGERLAPLGFKNLLKYPGGIKEWKEAGYPVEGKKAAVS